jgi:chromosome partitioning protein
MTDIIAVVNQKGGVAKTTTTIHVGVALAHLGKKVLLVDLDSQGHLAEGFGIVADKIEQEMSDCLKVQRVSKISLCQKSVPISILRRATFGSPIWN